MKTATQNGRVNVAHARKKKRLDSELERVLEQMERKREQMQQLDDKISDSTRSRDEKENELIDLEKDLVRYIIFHCILFQNSLIILFLFRIGWCFGRTAANCAGNAGALFFFNSSHLYFYPLP